MPSEVAPIAVFAYNRPDHLEQVFDALASCWESSQSALTVFCDGPKTSKDISDVAAVRAVAKRVQESCAFGGVTIVERDSNWGLGRSLIAGITSLLGDHDRIIVVEDDIVVSPDFLTFMNAALAEYADDDRVASVHGFAMNVGVDLPQTFFIRGADCWGWATWRRAWSLFEADGAKLLRRLDDMGLAEDFDFGGAFPYRDMLVEQIRGGVDSWAIRWYASTYLADTLTLYPNRSLVRNIGQEGSGTHSMTRPSHEVEAHRFAFPLQRIEIRESPEARRAMTDAFRSDASLAQRWKSGVYGAMRHLVDRRDRG
jgi:hypothetical protein